MVNINTPIYKTSIVNGHDVVRFASADSDAMRDISPLIDFDSSFSLVFVVDDNTSGTAYLQRSGSTQISFITRDAGSANAFSVGDGTTSLTASITNPTPARGNWWVIILVYDGSTSSLELYLNSDSVTASNTDSALNDLTDSYFYFGSTLSPDMDFAEWIFYNGHKLTSQEIQDMNDYMGLKYLGAEI